MREIQYSHNSHRGDSANAIRLFFCLVSRGFIFPFAGDRWSMASRQSPLFVDWEVHVALCICLDSGTSIRLDSDHLFFQPSTITHLRVGNDAEVLTVKRHI